MPRLHKNSIIAKTMNYLIGLSTDDRDVSTHVCQIKVFSDGLYGVHTASIVICASKLYTCH
jgi:hypothetical protein